MTTELDDDTKAALDAQGGADDVEPGLETNPEPEVKKDDLPEIQVTNPDATGEPKDPVPKEPTNLDADLDAGLSKNLADAGYSEEDLIKRIQKDDGISDELVEELKTKLDPDMVDAHAARLRAEYKLAKIDHADKLAEIDAKNKATVDMNTYIYDSVGGEDQFSVMSTALKESLDQTKLDALNVKLASGNKEVVQEALTSALKEYNNIRGMGGKLMEGDAGNATEQVLHLTKTEYRAIMKGDKYKTDPVYAKKIDSARLATREADKAAYGPGSYYGFRSGKGRYSL